MTSGSAINRAKKASQKKFYSQESLESSPRIRKAVTLIVLLTYITHLVLSLTLPSHFGSNPDEKLVLSYLLPSLATVICLLSHSDWLIRENNLKFTKLRLFLNFGAALAFTSYIAIFYPDTPQTPILEDSQDQQGNWAAANPILNEPFYILLIFWLVSPSFYLKALVTTGYYFGISTHLKLDNPALIWLITRNIVSWLLTLGLLAVQSGLRWRLFVKTSELEEWNKVYREILDRNPSCISVFSKEGMVYSNRGFEELTRNNTEDFFQSVVNLKRRDFFNINNQSVQYLSGHLTPLNSEESLVKIQGLVNKKSNPRMSTKPTQRMSTKTNRNSAYSFSNLLQLLNHYKDLLAKEQLPKDDQIIFDGKLMGKVDSPEKAKELDLVKEGRRQSLCIPISYEVIIKPFTEYKKLILIVNDTTERDLIVGLENNSEYKDKVLASVSHELRTPLNGNLGCIQSALSDNTVPEFVKKRFLIPAFNSGKLLLHFIEGILDYSLMQTEGIRLKPESKSLAETLKYCYELFEQSLRAKGLDLKIKWSNDLPDIFYTDHERLKQIVINLLSNAVKFTMKGGITLSASLLKGSRIEIKVEDTGVGMKQEAISRLFEERVLTTVGGFKGTHSKGVGLGLKISQRLAELLGANEDEGINVTSTYGQGSTFMFTIRDLSEYPSSLNSEATFDRGNYQGQEEHRISIEGLVASVTSQGDIIPHEHLNVTESILPAEPSKNYFKIKKPSNQLCISQNDSRVIASRNDSKKLVSRRDSPERTTICDSSREQRVLIVDDDPLNILVLETFVTQCGFLKDSALNGKEALDKIVKNPDTYKLIFMDCQMPIMDGFETTEKLVHMMKEGSLPVIPIVGCTAFVGQDKLDECIRSGMREVLPKPVIKDKIAVVLKKYLGVNSTNGLSTNNK